VAPLYDALAAAQRGLRKLVTLGEGEHRVSLSVVPLPAAAGSRPVTLLVLGKRQVCEQLSVQGYARAVSLTPAETRVLELLCSGVQPTVIAARQGVAVSTVRTQIGSIRAKTGAGSIRELVRQVAVLPPLVGALRNGAMGGLAPRGTGRGGPDIGALSS
jgi:DNA-binding CsgD family transcriptional regulator